MSNEDDGAAAPEVIAAEVEPVTVEEILNRAKTTLAEILSQLEQAKASTAQVRDAHTSAASVLGEIQTKALDATTVASQVSTALTKIHETDTAISAKVAQINESQKHIDDVRTDIDRVATTANQRASESEALRDRAQSACETAAAQAAAIQGIRASADSDGSAIATALTAARDNTATTKALAEKSETVSAKLAEYESKLASLEQKCTTQLDEITRLLPGATSAGLASAFDGRRQNFKKPVKNWQALFIGSIVALVVLTGASVWQSLTLAVPLSYDELFRLFLSRLPIVAALVWLALHSAREAALAKRVEEDYGYKAVIAASFQGFHAQMTDLDDKGNKDTPLSTLCANTLAAIAEPPGRIYEGHQLTVSPMNELISSVKNLTDVVKDVLPKKPTG